MGIQANTRYWFIYLTPDLKQITEHSLGTNGKFKVSNLNFERIYEAGAI